MFGRKKKQEQKAQDAEAPDYGVNVDDVSDDESSVPPPPPGTKGEAFKDENSNNEDGNTYQDEEGGDKNISFLTDSSDEGDDLKKEKEDDPNKRKKWCLIFVFIAMLAILIGLTVKYATKAPSTSDATSTGQDGDGFFDANGEAVPTEDGQVGVVTANPFEDGTLNPTFEGTDGGTEAGSEEDTFLGPGELDCAVDQIFASSTCSGGETSATITLCFNGAIEDQFWEWISTPAEYEEFIENDWGWLEDGTTIQRDAIPAGLYTIGLYSDGRNPELVELGEYPLIASTEFQVLCS